MEFCAKALDRLQLFISQWSCREDTRLADGTALYKGIEYTYSLSKKSWFGSYEICIEKSFVQGKPKRLQTVDFEIGGYIWQVHLEHIDDGFLAVYLHSRNWSTVKVHYSFTLINHSCAKEDESSGVQDVFSSGDSWGFGQFASVASICEENSGFLHEDKFTIRLNLRVKLPENESHAFCTNGKTGIFTWHLRYPKGMSPWVFRSEDLTIGNLKWNLELHPDGKYKDDQHMSLHLFSCNALYTKLRFSVTALSPKSVNKNFSKELKHTFSKIGEGQGWTNFLKTRELFDEKRGFLNDGWLTLVAHISIEKVLEPFFAHQLQDTVERSECVICLENLQTAGFLHGQTSHKCVCQDCAKLVANQQKPRCPICMLEVDRVIFGYF